MDWEGLVEQGYIRPLHVTNAGAAAPFEGTFADLRRRVGIKQIRIPRCWDARLKSLKYVALVAVLVPAAIPSAPAETVAEIEPFKTAITMNFLRSALFALYAAGLVIEGLFALKFLFGHLRPSTRPSR